MKKALIQLHIAIFLWGFTAVLGRLITLNAGLLVWWRMVLTVATLWVVFLLGRKVRRIPGPLMARTFGIGTLIVLHWFFFYASIKYANASIALVCLSSAGLFTALLEPVFFRRPLHFQEVALGMICIAGIACIFHFDPRYETGIVLGLIASILSCLFTIANKKALATGLSPENLTLYDLTGGLLFWSVSLPVYLHYFPEPHFFPGPADLGWLLVLSWACTVLAFTLSLVSLRKISPFTLTLTYNLEPVYGILLAFLVYREDKYLNGGFYVGFGLIVLSVTLQMLRLLREAREFLRGF